MNLPPFHLESIMFDAVMQIVSCQSVLLIFVRNALLHMYVNTTYVQYMPQLQQGFFEDFMVGPIKGSIIKGRKGQFNPNPLNLLHWRTAQLLCEGYMLFGLSIFSLGGIFRAYLNQISYVCPCQIYGYQRSAQIRYFDKHKPLTLFNKNLVQKLSKSSMQLWCMHTSDIICHVPCAINVLLT